MKKILVIGYKGFVGNEIFNKMISYGYETYGVDLDNYDDIKNKNIEYDVLINAGGNSLKFWANKNPKEDFLKSVCSTYNIIFDFKFEKYIGISSMDVYIDNCYGMHKKISEMIIKHHCKNFVILRCCAIIGKKMKKGVLKDILENKNLFISEDSYLQFITNTAVSEVIKKIIDLDIKNKIYDLGGKNKISIKKIGKILKKNINYNILVERQLIYRNTSKINKIFKLKTSDEYIMEVVDGRMEKSI